MENFKHWIIYSVGLFLIFAGVMAGLYIGVYLLVVAILNMIHGGPIWSNVLLIVVREVAAFLIGGGIILLGLAVLSLDDD